MARMRMSVVAPVLTVACLLLAATVATAVMPALWVQSAETDFSGADGKSIAVTNHGEVSLGRGVQAIMKPDAAPAVVSCLAIAGKIVYAGAGNENAIYKIDGEKTSKFAEPPGGIITSLLWTGKELLAGTGGEKAGIYRVDDKGQCTALWTDAKVKYVWAMIADGNTLYVATGPEGGVWAIDDITIAKPVGTLLYQAPAKLAKNILCMTMSAGKLYVGTDTNGLVIEVDPKAKTGRVRLDADEKEISGVVADALGNIYASTADTARSSSVPARPISLPSGRSDMNPSDVRPMSASAPSTLPSKPTASKPSGAGAGADSAGEPTKSDLEVSSGPEESSGPRTGSGGPSAPIPSVGPSMGSGSGNAVYVIHPDGMVTSIFRRPIAILSMAMVDGTLMLGGGNGAIYSVSTDGEAVGQIARTDAKQITALASADDGRLLFATAGKGSVAVLGKLFAKEGTLTAKAMDAHQIARWGTMDIQAQVPKGAKLTISTRSGNVSEPDDKTWSQWSPEQTVVADQAEGDLKVASPAGRFLQYRLKLTSDGMASPTIRRVQIIYQVGNLAPVVGAVTVQLAPAGGGNTMARGPVRGGDGDEAPGAKPVRMIAIQAADPNGDRLVYAVSFRAVGAENWIKIADKLQQPQFAWDTRTVGDDTYEIRATASDSPSNPPASALEATRIYKPVTVDNTAPVVKDLAGKAVEKKIAVTGLGVDASRIASIAYSVDSQEEWTSVLPKDGICDSPQEEFEFTTAELQGGSHRVAVKVEDIYGNVGYGTITVTLAK